MFRQDAGATKRASNEVFFCKHKSGEKVTNLKKLKLNATAKATQGLRCCSSPNAQVLACCMEVGFLVPRWGQGIPRFGRLLPTPGQLFGRGSPTPTATLQLCVPYVTTSHGSEIIPTLTPRELLLTHHWAPQYHLTTLHRSAIGTL